ncbi:phenoloxidase-activating factor 2 [Drosophila grimshawi]|uniref:GH11351 n=1 Tax=Drosophila grimshawi TaxID=7222 RepID=B4JED3_DROGR|nr:phenoloxidase-activating factor 2 [Drosophila grimshawi]EDW03653.1 GH11351 [Drosophila grimshawi]
MNGPNFCGNLETCCHKSDKILRTVVEAKISGCGLRHINGLSKTLNYDTNLEAQFGEFPWMAIIYSSSTTPLNYIGGGSILAPTIVLTAAHKVISLRADQLTVSAGEWDMKSVKEPYPHLNRNVSQIITHDGYSHATNNIALLVLQFSFSGMPNISPICLPNVHESFDNMRCIVTGWGARTTNTSISQGILKKIILPVLPRVECQNKLSKMGMDPIYFDQSSICAGGEKDVDTCNGDGGSPLVCPIRGHPNRFYQAGILTGGIGCGLEGNPALYTNVAHLMPWINQQLDKLGIPRSLYTL